jgi:hypothetical protein
MKTEGSYKPLEQPIAASNLQIIEIKCKDVDENEIVLKLLKVLIATGIPQEKIRIQYSAGKLYYKQPSFFVHLSICYEKLRLP